MTVFLPCYKPDKCERQTNKGSDPRPLKNRSLTSRAGSPTFLRMDMVEIQRNLIGTDPDSDFLRGWLCAGIELKAGALC